MSPMDEPPLSPWLLPAPRLPAPLLPAPLPPAVLPELPLVAAVNVATAALIALECPPSRACTRLAISPAMALESPDVEVAPEPVPESVEPVPEEPVPPAVWVAFGSGFDTPKPLLASPSTGFAVGLSLPSTAPETGTVVPTVAAPVVVAPATVVAVPTNEPPPVGKLLPDTSLASATKPTPAATSWAALVAFRPLASTLCRADTAFAVSVLRVPESNSLSNRSPKTPPCEPVKLAPNSL